MTFPATLSLGSLLDRLRLTVGGLRAVVAARGGRDRAMVPLVTLIWARLGRMLARFERLVAQVAAGRFPPARPPVTARVRRGAEVQPAAADDGRPAVVRLPWRFAWLVRAVQETAQFGGQVRAVLQDAERIGLVAASPGVGRVLRRLCWMLAVEPDPEPVAQTRRPCWLPPEFGDFGYDLATARAPGRRARGPPGRAG